jgi:cytochrome c-type biogenesis protein CcmH
MNYPSSSFPRRRESLFRSFLRFAAIHPKSRSDSRLRGNDGFLHSGLRTLLLTVLLFGSFSAFAQPATPDAPLQFRDAAEEARFHALASELRCVMCQNQSLADSNAQIARDLRNEILQLMRRGQSDEQIEQFLVARYGEFVLYKPRVEASTWLLWFGPALVLLAGGAVVFAIVRRRSRAVAASDDAQEW